MIFYSSSAIVFQSANEQQQVQRERDEERFYLYHHRVVPRIQKQIHKCHVILFCATPDGTIPMEIDPWFL